MENLLLDLMLGGSGSSGSADPMAALGALGGIGSAIMTVINTLVSSFILFVVIVLLMLVAYWTITGFKWLHIGRKAGLEKDWMPFVPVAKALYRLKIVDEAWWMVFFLEGWWFYGGILFIIIVAISNFSWMIFGMILVGLYWGCCVAYNIYWRYKYYIAFDIKPHLAISIFVPFTGGMRRVVDYLVAFTSNYDFGGTGAATSKIEGAKNFVNVQPKAPATPQAGSLSGLSGMYAGQTIPLAPNEDLLIGRDNTCNLIIDRNAEKLSRKHCSILYNTSLGCYMVTDYSSNGTYIDGGNRLVANMATQLQRGTVIALGNRENRFKLN